jgi:hypothetical protein
MAKGTSQAWDLSYDLQYTYENLLKLRLPAILMQEEE